MSKKETTSDEKMGSMATSIAYSGAAVLANQTFITKTPAGLRLAFTEHAGPDVSPQFRTAVIIPFQEAISLYKLMQAQLEDIEIKIEEETKKSQSKEDSDG